MKYVISTIILLVAATDGAPIALVDMKGRSVSAEIVAQQGDSVTFRRDDGKEYTVPLSTLNDATKLAIAKDLESQNAAKEVQGISKDYEMAVSNVLRAKRSIKYFIGSDIEVAKKVVQLQESFISEYVGSESARKAAHEKLARAVKSIYESKPVVGYKYNEILKKQIEMPITFNLYEDADLYYIKIGDGDFSTIASISPKQLLNLTEMHIKMTEWIEQCIADKMDVRKDVGQFGGISIEFISSDSSDNIYLLLTANGQFAGDRLLEKQVVSINLLNWTCLITRIAKVKELNDARDKRRANAEKLK